MQTSGTHRTSDPQGSSAVTIVGQSRRSATGCEASAGPSQPVASRSAMREIASGPVANSVLSEAVPHRS